MKYDLLYICEGGVCKNYVKINDIEKPLDEIVEQSIKCEELFDKIENLEAEILDLKRHLKFIIDCMPTETVFDILDKMFESEEYFNKK